MPAIRDTLPDDLPRIHALIERAYRGPLARAGWTHEADMIEGPRTTLAAVAAILADPRQRLLSAWDDDTPVGCVTVADLGGGRTYLGQLCVEPQRQAGGIGSQLIAAAERTAIDAFGATRIEMTVIDTRDTLIAYYERRGYRTTGERRDFPVPMTPPLFMTVLEKSLTC